ncbi:12422_t:CDS:2 [Ambispora leptoticha]|uniref:12422_t:CDS:1 n=1 Tax=Ambispora leptoticha TaxID=144679 RepID=A0A9N8YSN8_9GLOM|nr:12422_t:CDS:2 [Ambispora leptoticha]
MFITFLLITVTALKQPKIPNIDELTRNLLPSSTEPPPEETKKPRPTVHPIMKPISGGIIGQGTHLPHDNDVKSVRSTTSSAMSSKTIYSSSTMTFATTTAAAASLTHTSIPSNTNNAVASSKIDSFYNKNMNN